MPVFEGTYTVLVTPFTESGEAVDEPALRRLVNWQIEEGIHGLIPLGSTGEFLSIEREERQQVIEICISEAAGRVPVLVGTSAESTRHAIEYSREAEAMGADGVMVISPFYASPTDAELFEHFRAIGEAISVPIMIYNNPATANVDLTPDQVSDLARIDNVTMVKESTMDVTRVRDIIDQCGDRISVFAGILGYESFWLGAKGWVAVCSNLMPRESARLYDLVANHADRDTALALYQRMLPIVRWVGGHRYVSATKAALSEMGLPVGKPRPPRLPLPGDEHAALVTDLEKLGLLQSLRPAMAG